MISQVSVFLENEEGRLAEACRCIADAGISMTALFVADAPDYGVARIFCKNPADAVEALQNGGFRAKLIDVLAVRVPDRAGGLADLLEFLSKNGINIDYGYCFTASDDTAIDVLKVSEKGVEERLVEAGFELYG